MSKTASEVIAESISQFDLDEGAAAAGACDLIRDINAAGFVIVPKEPRSSSLQRAGFGYDEHDEHDGICPCCCYDGLWGNELPEARLKIGTELYRALIAPEP